MSKKKDKNSRKKAVKKRGLNNQISAVRRKYEKPYPFNMINYEITGEPLTDDEPVYPEEYNERKEAIYNRLIQHAQEGGFDLALKTKFINDLSGMIEEYPEDNTIKNYLSIVYQLSGDIKKHKDYTKEITESSPEYLFARFQMAIIYLEEEEFTKAYELFDGKLDLKAYLPDRNMFHCTEASSMFAIAVMYYQWSGDDDLFLLNYDLLKAVDASAAALIKVMPHYLTLTLDRFE